jgi:DNA-binding MarR family transcriptional regulator
MPVKTHSTLAVRESDVRAVRAVLASADLLTPEQIASRAHLTRTAVASAVNGLERAGEVEIVRQATTPRVRVRLVLAAKGSVERSN